jgi:hypothetical protein
MIINWLPCCWSYGRNLVIKQFMQTHENGCCCLCLAAASAPNTSMFDVASWMSCVFVWRCSVVRLRTMALVVSCLCAQDLPRRLICLRWFSKYYYNVYVDVCSWLLCLCLTQRTWSFDIRVAVMLLLCTLWPLSCDAIVVYSNTGHRRRLSSLGFVTAADALSMSPPRDTIWIRVEVVAVTRRTMMSHCHVWRNTSLSSSSLLCDT